MQVVWTRTARQQAERYLMQDQISQIEDSLHQRKFRRIKRNLYEAAGIICALDRVENRIWVLAVYVSEIRRWESYTRNNALKRAGWYR